MCAAHSIDLLIKDIVKIDWARATVEAVRKTIKFIKHHQVPLAIFDTKSGNKTLVLPSETRFGTSVIMLSRFQEVRPVGFILMAGSTAVERPAVLVVLHDGCSTTAVKL